MSDCKHFDICGLPRYEKDQGEQCCILHFSDRSKDKPTFSKTLHRTLSDGRSDFRYAVFPTDYNFQFPQDQKRCPGLLNLANVTLDNDLDLRGIALPRGLVFSTASLRAINLQSSTIEGPVNISVTKDLQVFSCEKASISGTVLLSVKFCRQVSFDRSKVKSRIYLETANGILDASFRHAEIHGGVGIKGANVDNLHFDSAEILFGDIDVDVSTSQTTNLEARSAKFRKAVTVTTKMQQRGLLDFEGAELDGLLTVRTTDTKFSCKNAHITKGVDCTQSHMKLEDAAFERVLFDASSKLIFDSSTVEGNLSLLSSPTPPKSVNLNGCKITGKTTIRSELGKPLIEVIAKQKAPDLCDEVNLTNVSLKECRLLGNAIAKIRMSNVTWDDSFGRATLYDERFLGDSRNVIRNLREACQILKENYRQAGDHSTSGDFHFGEMEMKRREYGFLKRTFGWEGLYYHLSGYGTQPLRAASFLFILLTVVCVVFALWGGGKLQYNALEAFIFTLQCATFQPLTIEQQTSLPSHTRLIGSLVRVAVPLQAGLLALAIRMRLKR
jgi:uncharacterized protein YjbI with pentapeptide repeats